MIGIQRERLANWCNHNIDLLIVACGAVILTYVELIGDYMNIIPNLNYGFLILLAGVIMLSIGVSALICYRILLRWHGFF